MASFPETELLMPWNFLGARSVFCFNAVTLSGLLDGGRSPERPSHDGKFGISSPHPPSSRVNHQSYLCDEAAMKVPEVRGWKSPQVGEHVHVPGWWHTVIPRGQKYLHSGPFWTLSYASLHLALHQNPL